MANKIELTVVMSVYNGEKYLCDAVDSILSQSFENFEFIIINDGSTDSTNQILDRYSKVDKRIILINNLVTEGLAASLNTGISCSRANLIARMDADDISLPSRFSTQVNFLESHPEIGVLGTYFKLIDSTNHIITEEIAFPTDPDFIKWSFFFYNPLVHPSIMMRKEIITSIGGYDPKVDRSQDKDLWIRLFWKTQFSNVPETLLYLRKHSSNNSITGYSTGLEHNVGILKKLLSTIVGYDVSYSCIRNIYKNDFPSNEGVLEAIQLILDLYNKYSMLCNPTQEANELIRLDAYQRVGVLLAKLPPTWREKVVFPGSWINPTSLTSPSSGG